MRLQKRPDLHQRRGEQQALLERLKDTYSRLEKNGQLLGTNLTRLLTGIEDAQRRTARLNGSAGTGKAQSRSNAA